MELSASASNTRLDLTRSMPENSLLVLAELTEESPQLRAILDENALNFFSFLYRGNRKFRYFLKSFPGEFLLGL